MKKNQKIIASGFMKSIKNEPRKNGIFITYIGTPLFHQTDVDYETINKKFLLIIEEESKEEK